jgi:hypothetical protein
MSSSIKPTFGFTAADLDDAKRIRGVNHFASAPPSKFGQSDPSWKFPTTYTTIPGSNFGSYVQTFGVSNPSWTLKDW